mgnify:CR=1 FL=1
MAPMRAAIAGKSPDEVVELQTKGELEGEITSSDFLGAVETTPPSIAPGSLRRFEAWNAEFGCELRAPAARVARRCPLSICFGSQSTGWQTFKSCTRLREQREQLARSSGRRRVRHPHRGF